MSLVATDVDIEYVYDKDKVGVALVWVIGEDCLYDAPVQEKYAQIFLSHDQVYDVSSEYPNHNGIAVRFIKDKEVLLDFLTTEYFGSILLSQPSVLKLGDYPYGRYVDSPNAKFDGEKFIITNRDMSNLSPWMNR